jgi:hypothetical protein
MYLKSEGEFTHNYASDCGSSPLSMTTMVFSIYTQGVVAVDEWF